VALLGGEPRLLQPDGLELGDLLVGDAGVCRPAPQRQRLGEQPGRFGRGRGVGVGDQPLEVPGVDLPRLDREQVAGRPCEQPAAVTGAELKIDLSKHGDRPRLVYDPHLKGYPVWLFSDLKRHDLGEENAARHVDHGVSPQLYLTRRLWGLASTAPYMYDGRAPSLESAMAMHGGEASSASVAGRSSGLRSTAVG